MIGKENSPVVPGVPSDEFLDTGLDRNSSCLVVFLQVDELVSLFERR
jgi:hypothetical protein